MKQDDKRDLETELMQMGLAGLDDLGNPSGELVQQIAAIVNHWDGYESRLGEWIDKHKFVRDLLNECDVTQRYAMYTALVPKLTFKALPLQSYEDMIAERAGRMVSQRRARVTGDRPKPIEVGGHKFALATKQDATNAIATVRCHQCNKVDSYVETTPVGAMYAARQAGWVRDKGVNKELCAACLNARVNVALD